MSRATLCIWLVLLVVLVAAFVVPRIEQARRKFYPPRSYSEAQVRDQPLLTLRGHARRVNRSVFSPDGKRIASAGGDGDATVKIWNSQTGELLRTLSGHDRGVYNVAFRPDGKVLASAGHDHTVRLWDVATGEAIRTIEGLEIHVQGVAFSPDGKRLATGDGEGVRLWDVETGQEVLAFRGGEGGSRVAFSPDGKRLAAGRGDWTVRVWDADSGQELLTFKGHNERVWGVAFSPDGEAHRIGQPRSQRESLGCGVWSRNRYLHGAHREGSQCGVQPGRQVHCLFGVRRNGKDLGFRRRSWARHLPRAGRASLQPGRQAPGNLRFGPNRERFGVSPTDESPLVTKAQNLMKAKSINRRQLLAATAAAGAVCWSAAAQEPLAKKRFAIALHGGAGRSPERMTAEQIKAAQRSLSEALDVGTKVLSGGGTSLDAVEQVIRQLEDDPLFNAGKGAVFNAAGGHELDASIMDGRTRACGGVAAVRTVRHPISLARQVMEKTRHVLLTSDGAERFADEMQVERVENQWFDTDRQREAWEKAQKAEANKQSRRGGEAPAEPGATTGRGYADAPHYGTVGCVCLDTNGNLAAGTSTGGLTNKKFGRVGDSPIVGAGTYADNATCAVSGTGIGEQFIRHAVAYDISARMRYLKQPLGEAVSAVLSRTLRKDDGGIIAVGADGTIAMDFSTGGMARAAADSGGRREIKLGR